MTEGKKHKMQIISTQEDIICPFRHINNISGGKWKMPILCILSMNDSVRYNTMKRKLGKVTNTMLAQSLKELERDGLIDRKQYNEIPPRVEYRLTKTGEEMVALMVPLCKWAEEHMSNEFSQSSFCDQCAEMR